jgi:hypothetical protein
VGRIGGGIAGWLIGALPLVAVNLASVENVLDQRSVTTVGVVALVGGLLLGGVCAGALGARARDGGGLVGAGAAGASAALFYTCTLMGVMISSAQLGVAPPVIAIHPIRVTVAIVFLASLLVLVALASGAVVARLSGTVAEQDTLHLPASARSSMADPRGAASAVRRPAGSPAGPVPNGPYLPSNAPPYAPRQYAQYGQHAAPPGRGEPYPQGRYPSGQYGAGQYEGQGGPGRGPQSPPAPPGAATPRSAPVRRPAGSAERRNGPWR